MASIAACTICGEGDGDNGSVRMLGKKGLSTFIEASIKREDQLHEKVSSNGEYCVHDKCYKWYTAAKNISAQQARIDGENSPSLSLRSHHKPYDFHTHCLICAEELNFEAACHNPGCVSHISNVEIVSRDKTSLIQESLLQACDKRQDVQALNVKSRINFAGDLRAVEAKYHQKCMQAFLSKKNIAHSSSSPQENVRNLNSLNDEAFLQMCEWVREQEECQFTLVDLRTKLASYLPKDVPAYSTVHIKRRLLEHFGKEVTVAEIEGKKNVVTFKKKAAAILYGSYVDAPADDS